MPKFDIITVGGAIEDITFFTGNGQIIDNAKDIERQKLLAFEQGAKIKVENSYSSFGGGAANSAVNFARLGFKTGIITSLGDDLRANAVINNFKFHKVKTDFIKRVKGVATGISFIIVDQEHERLIFSNNGSKEKLEISEREKKALSKTNWIYISSLSGNWRQALSEIFSVNNKKIAWNPGQKQIESGVKVLKKFLKQTTVLSVNKDEAVELLLTDGKSKDKDRAFLMNTKNLLAEIKKLGPEIVVITSGKDGADAYDGKNFYHQDILPEKKRVDSTGLGDAFSSSFVAGLQVYKGDINKALYLGIRTTASVIAKQGAQNGLLTKADL